MNLTDLFFSLLSLQATNRRNHKSFMVPRILLTTQKMMIPVPVGRSQQVLDGHKVPTVGSDASDAAATPVSVDSFPFPIRLFFLFSFCLPRVI